MSPDVSVVIPARNAAATLAETLDSLAAQTYPGWQAIIVDDKSSDATLAVANEYAARDARIIVIPGEGAGVCRARNVGIAHAVAPWVMFLDADDWLTPPALERLLARAAATEADAVYGAWMRVDPSGRITSRRYPEPAEDMFAVFARQAYFAIHSCIVRRELVVEAGGFDERLVTCEDWDLWQRLARAGARFAGTNDDVALYRMRPGSASMDARQMLVDAFRVIASGHGPDARVANPSPAHVQGRPPEEAASPKLAYLAWAAGLLTGAGGDARSLVTELDDTPFPNADASHVAAGFFEAVPLASCRGIDAWPELWEAYGERVHAVLEQIEARLRAPMFTRRVEYALASLALAEASTLPFAMVRTLAVRVHADQPIPGIDVPSGVDRVFAQVEYGGERLGNVEIGVANGFLAADTLREAIAERFWWDLLRFVCCPHTWEAFLQSLWNAPGEPEARFYADAVDVELASRGAEPGAPSIPVEISASLPRVDVRRGASLLVLAGGSPVAELDVPPARGSLDARRLRSTITLAAGLELGKAAARNAIVGWPQPDRASLSERLRQRARQASATGAVLTVAVPIKGRAGRTMRPSQPPAPATMRAHGRHKWEGVFAAAADPWRYTSPYETRKYEQTLSLALLKRPRRALELACAEGHFTAVLAPRVEQVVAADISAIAVDRARARCAGHSNIEWRRIDLVTDPLPGDMDLIVCSEVLYYVGDRAVLEHVARKLAGALAPGGVLVCAHANVFADGEVPAFEWDVPFGAKTVGATLATTPGLRLARELRTRYYRVQQFERWDDRGSPPPPIIEQVESEQPPASVARSLRTTSVAPAPLSRDVVTERLPILMYHRISSDGPSQTAGYRVSPAAFEEQLAYLRDSGFASATFDEWRIAASRRRPLPGRRVMITFDDGYEDFAREAWPLLKRYGFRAVLFVVTGHAGGTNTWDAAYGDPVPLLAWDALRALAADGVDLGTHSAAHAPLTALSSRELQDDLSRARDTLAREVGVAPAAIAYPYGAVDSVVAAAAARCGYQFGVTCRPDPARYSDSMLELPRVDVRGSDTLLRFIAKLDT